MTEETKTVKAPKVFQQLSISLKGGQVVTIPFNAEKADRLNPQIEAFMKALGEKDKQEGNFLFQGSRVVLVRLSDVSACDVVSLIEKTEEEEEEKATK